MYLLICLLTIAIQKYKLPMFSQQCMSNKNNIKMYENKIIFNM